MARKGSAATMIVTTFGAGLACAYLAPTAEASTISLTFSPQSVFYYPDYGYPRHDIHLTPLSSSLRAYHDFYGKNLVWPGGGLRTTAASNDLTTGNIFYPAVVLGGVSSAGTKTIGFLTPNNQVGWFRVTFGVGTYGPIRFVAGAYNDVQGGSIHVGAGADGNPVPVPEPSSVTLLGLSALAAGARGVRRMRGK